MLAIAHRGNFDGPSKFENEPNHVLKTWRMGYDVEVDVSYIDGKFYLGHDTPDYEVDSSFLQMTGVWCHAKTIEALHAMLDYEGINCFWHQEDDFTLTSKNYIWTYPGKFGTRRSVIVDLHKNWILKNYSGVFGICTDYPNQKP